MRAIAFCLLLSVMPCATFAMAVASAKYVEIKTESKVDTSSTAQQTMAGTYTVSGTLIVPTPPLPSAE